MKTRLYVRVLALWLALLGLTAPSHVFASLPPDDHVGIHFFTGTWNELLAEAKKQKKPVFVDVYTTWCGPCKLMAKQAFPDKAVGDLFNANFISYQIDAEKGEGIEVAKKYNVTAYPTSLFVSADGDLIQRTVGYGGIKGLVDEANKAIEAARTAKPIALWDKEFANGKRDADFLKTYLAQRAQLGLPNGDALDAYLLAAPEADLTTPAGLELISGNLTTTNSKGFDWLLDGIKANQGQRTSAPAVQKAVMAVSQLLARDERKATSEAEMERVIANRMKLTQKLGMKGPAGTTATDGMWLNFYKRTKNVPKYREFATKSAQPLMAVSADSLKTRNDEAYQRFLTQTQSLPDSVKKTANFKRYADQMKNGATQQTAQALNSLAWGYFETLTDPADLNQALAWSGRSLELNRSAASLDTYAQLLGKLGRKPEAIKYEEEALALAKKTGEDAADYEKTLAALKQ
ncbi:thioredoxin domain protein [Fibrella aestuarina BUZ 2]|uniref:Thioredoxin domain protein n=1 Tax=Fibrella aestuarina BUZ 2 TaxID=1166018 RepID=I0K7F8_9BACT|nr:thioredoxin family protein [Fibrella aestuarina]CCH00061.1 thioredoxin domain protein [Fibrella aestuarina BUZ 2]